MGGHDIRETDIRCRFERSRQNFVKLYMPVADQFTLFGNSTDGSATVVAQGVAGAVTE